MTCPYCKTTALTKKVEDGGVLLRGNAPILRVQDGRLVIIQRCPTCKRTSRYSPLMIRIGGEEKAGRREA